MSSEATSLTVILTISELWLIVYGVPENKVLEIAAEKFKLPVEQVKATANGDMWCCAAYSSAGEPLFGGYLIIEDANSVVHLCGSGIPPRVRMERIRAERAAS